MNNSVYERKIHDLTTFTKVVVLTRIAIDLYAFSSIATLMIEKVFVAIIVIILGVANYAIADSNAIYEGSNNYDYVSFGKILMLCSAAFTGIALWLFFMDLSASFSQQAIVNHPSVRVATSNYESAHKQLEQIRGSHSYTQEQLDTAVVKKAQIDTEIEKAQAAFERSNKQAIAAHQTQVVAFWSKNVDGLKMLQIMDRECNPLKSPYGNGLMKSSSEKACPDWKKLREASPMLVANSSSAVQALGDSRKEVLPIVDVVTRLQKAEDYVTSTKSVLLAVQEKLATQEIYPSLFMRLPELTKGYVTPLVGATVFFAFILVVLIGLPIYLTHAIVFLRQQIVTGNIPTATEHPRAPSLLGRLYAYGKERTNEYLDKNMIKKRPIIVQQQTQDVPMAVVKTSDIHPSDTQETSVQTVKPLDMPSSEQVKTDENVIADGQNITTQKDIQEKYQMVLRARRAKNLESYSIPYLGRRFGMSHTAAEQIRDMLVRDGHAAYTDKKRCIPTEKKRCIPINGQSGMF